MNVYSLHRKRFVSIHCVEYRANCHDFAVIVDSLQAADRFSEEPRAHRVIEQIRLGEFLCMLNHSRDERSIRNADARDQSSLRRVPIDEHLCWLIRLLLVADRIIFHRSPPLFLGVPAVVLVNRFDEVERDFSASSRLRTNVPPTFFDSCASMID